tara:strand:+ start:29 stop:376 length:348 start_codon:yes stop_codon:yes gene_type:complete
MAVTKAITKCTPYINSNSKVDKWDIEMKYENGNEGDSTYYTFTFSTTVKQKDVNSVTGAETTNFTLKAKGSWSNADLVALCPVSQWDAVFASQVDSVVTNPPTVSTPDAAFNVPS